ncbi:MAG: ketoacyl-ACP synthase III [Cystobacterineae bacterium]|nr:ketoacyl-ACP synthase III [Cystobacterineae bacterium]
MRRVKIIGTGSYVPSKVLSNHELAARIETSDAWIVARTGIRERRIAAPEEATSDLAFAASVQALEMAGLSAEKLDMVLVATVTPDMQTPACAVHLAHKLGAKNAFAFDLSAACAGSLFAMSVASQYIATGAVKSVLVVGAELLSRITNWEDRGSSILFGDGAGAMVLVPTEEADSPERGLLKLQLYSDGSAADILCIPGGGSRFPLTPESFLARHNKVSMRGREVYKFAVTALVQAVERIFSEHNISLEQVKHVMAHQANVRILEAILERIGIPIEKAHININRYGNTSSASVPLTLDEANRAGKLQAGDLILVMAIGAGMSWGAGLIRW